MLCSFFFELHVGYVMKSLCLGTQYNLHAVYLGRRELKTHTQPEFVWRCFFSDWTYTGLVSLTTLQFIIHPPHTHPYLQNPLVSTGPASSSRPGTQPDLEAGLRTGSRRDYPALGRAGGEVLTRRGPPMECPVGREMGQYTCLPSMADSLTLTRINPHSTGLSSAWARRLGQKHLSPLPPLPLAIRRAGKRLRMRLWPSLYLQDCPYTKISLEWHLLVPEEPLSKN